MHSTAGDLRFWSVSSRVLNAHHENIIVMWSPSHGVAAAFHDMGPASAPELGLAHNLGMSVQQQHLPAIQRRQAERRGQMDFIRRSFLTTPVLARLELPSLGWVLPDVPSTIVPPGLSRLSACILGCLGLLRKSTSSIAQP